MTAARKTAAPAAPQLLSTEQVAQRLGVGANTVLRLVAAGDLDAVDIATRGSRPRLRYREDKVAELIERRTVRTGRRPA